MFISEMIKRESWNGGKWIESVHKDFGFYSISINPKDDGDKHPRLIVVIDDPSGDEESFMRMIPDQEINETKIDSLNNLIETLYTEIAIGNGEICDEFKNNYSIRKINNSCWQVLYKDFILGEYSTYTSAKNNICYRIDMDWGEKFGDSYIAKYNELNKQIESLGLKKAF